jgi:photosystem II stability/assembly factor-like uncharacterized protein
MPFGGSLKVSISFSDTLHGWAVGYFAGSSVGVIWRTTNGGISWTEKQDDNRNYHGTAAQTSLWNITSGNVERFSIDTGLVTRTTNAGSNWTERVLGDSIISLGKVQFVDSVHGWIIAQVRIGPAGVVRTVDCGQTWTFHPTPRGFVDISFIDSLRGWAASFFSPFNVVRTTDGGRTWGIVYTHPSDIGVDAISFVDSLNGWFFGNVFYQGGIREVIYKTTDGGYTWFQESIGLSSALTDGVVIDRQHGWAVADDGRVLAYRQVVTVPERLPEIPTAFALLQNYPNPFNPLTTIEYHTPNRVDMRIVVYDVTGREVRVLVDGPHEAGAYRIRFDATSLASGSYWYHLVSGSYQESRQMILTK